MPVPVEFTFKKKLAAFAYVLGLSSNSSKFTGSTVLPLTSNCCVLIVPTDVISCTLTILLSDRSKSSVDGSSLILLPSVVSSTRGNLFGILINPIVIHIYRNQLIRQRLQFGAKRRLDILP